MISSRKLVSIVTPSYNAAKTLGQCIESVREQTYPYWEHIIVDDGSTDGSWDLLEELYTEDSRIRILHQTNAGQGKARNEGIAIANGDYIALLDADDECLPERLELQVNFLDSRPDIDVVGGAIINISESGKTLGKSYLYPDHVKLVADIYRRCPFFTSTVMGRPDFFQQAGGFDISFPRAEDYDLWLRSYRRFRFHNLQIPLVYYRRDTQPSWRNSFYSAHAIFKAIVRDGKSPFHLWYAMRPLVAAFLSKSGFRYNTYQ